MTTATKKLENAYAQLNEEDRQAFLAQIADVDTEIVAYTISGEPLTRSLFIKEMEDTDKEIAEGKVISHEQLLSAIATW